MMIRFSSDDDSLCLPNLASLALLALLNWLTRLTRLTHLTHLTHMTYSCQIPHLSPWSLYPLRVLIIIWNLITLRKEDVAEQPLHLHIVTPMSHRKGVEKTIPIHSPLSSTILRPLQRPLSERPLQKSRDVLGSPVKP